MVDLFEGPYYVTEIRDNTAVVKHVSKNKVQKVNVSRLRFWKKKDTVETKETPVLVNVPGPDTDGPARTHHMKLRGNK